MKQDKYLSVNWKDGMKINKSHFIAQENSFIYRLSRNNLSLINEHNYGVIPGINDTRPGLRIYVSSDNEENIQLRVLKCLAITAGGHYIEIDEDNFQDDNILTTPILNLSVPFYEAKEKAGVHYIVITINPYERYAFGDADPSELPPRVPFTIPSLHLSLLPEGEIIKNAIGQHQIPVGKLIIDEQRVSIDKKYIPPCSSITSHSELTELHAEIERFYGEMEVHALQIVQKISQKKQNNDLAVIAQKLCENITLFTANHIAELKMLSLTQPPVHLVTKLCTFARIFKNTFDCFLGAGKEELINYCAEWCDVNQADMEGAIKDLANHQYNHLDIRNSLDKIERFIKIISGLFYNLARLDYIGKRRDAGIFVKEQVIVKEPETPFTKRKSFLAE